MAFELMQLMSTLQAAGVTLDGASRDTTNLPPGSVVVMTADGVAARLDGVPQAQQALALSTALSFTFSGADLTFERGTAQALLSDNDPRIRLLVAVCMALVDETNRLRGRLTAQDAAVAAFTTTADLKARWAAIASTQPLPQISYAQARTAVKNKAATTDTDPQP